MNTISTGESSHSIRAGARTPTRIVFAGAGHAHLYSMKRAARFISAGYDVFLINPSPYLHYSGMATGVISGVHPPNEARIDVRRLVERGGGRFIAGRVERVLTEDHALLLENGESVSYDFASFCLGSETRTEGLPDALPVKPVENLVRLRRELLDAGGRADLLVVGGGAAGCEVAANASALIKGAGITLVEAGPELLAFAPKKARRLMLDYLGKERGVEVVLGREVARAKNGSAVLDDGREVRAGIVAAATGVAPPSRVFTGSGLATGDDGSLWVDHHLRSISDERLFGGGDSTAFRGEALPRFGVHAIRQGPVLFHNLLAAMNGEPLKTKTFQPQKRFLYILSLGDGTGLAVYGPLAWRGRAAMALKNYIDRRFIEEYR